MLWKAWLELMQVDYLSSRLDRLKASSQQVAALAEIHAVRSSVLSQVQYRKVADDEFFDEALRLFKKREIPFQNLSLLEKVNWKKCAEIIRNLLRELVKAGLKDGSVQELVRGLEANHGMAFELCKRALDGKQEAFFSLAAKYGVEPDLMRFIVITPLVPIFHRLRQLLPSQDNPIPITACPLCGAKYSTGTYQSGYRFVMCSVCNHRVCIDQFFCPRCANTKPDEMGFVKLKEEPILQIDYCLRCGSYFKMVREELMATSVSDAVLLDLSTMDLDSLGQEILKKQTKPASA